LDTKSKKSNKFAYKSMFALCVVSFIAAMLLLMIAELDRTAYFPIMDHILSAYHGISLICGLLTLSSFIYLAGAAGDRGEDGKIELKSVDMVYTEIQLLVISAVFMAGGMLFVRMAATALYDGLRVGGIISGRPFIIMFEEPVIVAVVIACAIGIIAAATGLWLILSCIRKIKGKIFLRQSIIGVILIALYETVFVGGSLMRKAMLIAVLSCLLSSTIFLAPVVLVLIFIFLPKLIREFEEIKKGVEEVKSGNLSYEIPVITNSELDVLATGINEISQSSSAAVQNEMKNQRMKAELISNVSHDLKTPLTSLVTYIDLLKTEGLTSEKAPEYLGILEQKTNRLKQLTDDLFEAAKAASGTIPVRKEKVDMLSLVNQGLGEMNQKITESGLEMIIKAELEKYYVWADGQLLWRVVENLLGNVLKYAAENTRVYINITEQKAPYNHGMVILEIKNISKQALNIEADELMERFKRGDESRATEGSGLGLAIAKDLVKLQNGWLEIKIDGDLFKATVMLEKAE